jgi:type VI secretion system secreted protein Hcp
MRILKGVFRGSTTRRRGVLVAILFSLATGPSPLATPIFLKVEGIDGDVRSAGHEEWIEVQRYQWGVSRPGMSKRPRASCAGVQDLNITKRMDASSPALRRAAASKHRFGFVELDLHGEKHRLESVLVKSVRPGGSTKSGGDRIPLEEISFNYSKCTFHYKEQTETGKPKPTPPWDVKRGRP